MSSSNLDQVLRHIRQLIGSGAAELTDGELLERFVAKRDEGAFAELVRRYGGLVLGASRRVLGNAPFSEDVFQATFLVLVRKAASLNGRRPLGNWLYTVASRLALTARASDCRRRLREQRAARAEAVQASEPDEWCLVLEEELQRLPDRYRALLVLCYLEGKSHDQAAQALGWPRGSISRQLAKALDLLRDRLRCRGYADPAAAVTGLLTAASANACVPLPLLIDTVRAGILFAEESRPKGPLSAEALTLAQGILHTMAVQKLKIAAAMLFLATMLGSGSALLVRAMVGARADAPAVPVHSADPSQEAMAKLPRPAGASARMGSTLLRQGDTILFVAYSRDGRWLVTAGADQSVCLWDVTTGLPLWRRRLPDFLRAQAVSAGAQASTKPTADAEEAKENSGLDALPSFRLALAPDGKLLALANADRVTICETETGQVKQTISLPPDLSAPKGPANDLVDLVFADQGKFLVTANGFRTVRAWNVATGLLAKDAQHEGSVGDSKATLSGGLLALSPGGRYLAWEQFDQKAQSTTLRLKDLHTGKEWPGVPVAFGGTRAMAFAPDGRFLAWASANDGIHVLDCVPESKPRLLWADPPGSALVESIAISSNDKMLGACRSDGTFSVWALDSGKLLRQIGASPPPSLAMALASVTVLGRPPAASPLQLAFAPDGKTVATSLGGVSVRRFDVTTGQELTPGGNGHSTAVAGLRPMPDGKTLVSFAGNDPLYLWDLTSGRNEQQVALPDHAACVAVSQDGRYGATCTNGTIHILDVPSGREVTKIDTGTHPLVNVALSPDGKTVATRGQSPADVSLWDRSTGRLLHTLARNPKPGAVVEVTVTQVSGVLAPELIYSQDSRYVAGAGLKRQLCLWDVASGGVVWEKEFLDGQVLEGLAFSDNGLALAAIHRDGTVSIVEAATGEVRCLLSPHLARHTPPLTAAIAEGRPVMMLGLRTEKQPSRGVTFAPGSRLLAASRGEAVIHLWDVVQGEEIGQLKGHGGNITCLAFCPDGRRLVSGSQDTTALVWDLAAYLRPAIAKGPDFGAQELDALWSDLAGSDAAKAFTAIRKLSTQPARAAALAKGQVRPAQAADPARLDKLVADLGNPDLAIRQQAASDLEQCAEQALPILQKKLASDVSLDVRQRVERLRQKILGPATGERLRQLRVVELLELAGSPDCRQVLNLLAQGAPHARVTQQATAALVRLERQR